MGIKIKKIILTIIITATVLPIGCGKLIKQTDNRQDNMNIQTNKEVNIEQIQEKNYEVAYNPTRVVFNDNTVAETLEIADKLSINHANAKEAYGLYKWISEQDPTNANALIGMGYCYGTVSNYPKALEYVEKTKPYLTTEMEPKKLAHAYYKIGLIYAGSHVFEQDKYLSEMEEAFGKVFEVEGLSEKDRHFYYCHTYQQQVNGYNNLGLREEEKAIALLLKLDELQPNDDAVNYRLATAYINIGQPDKAKVYVDYFMKNHPDEITKVLMQAKYYSALGEYREADTYFDKAKKIIQSDTDENKYYAALTYHVMRKKDYKRAHEYIQRFIDMNITNVMNLESMRVVEESGYEIDPKDIEAFEKAKQEAYSTSLE